MNRKPCQVCGFENQEAEFFCRNCGSEIALASAPTVPPGPAKNVSGGPVNPGQAPWVCRKCGQSNEAVFSLCTRCGFDSGLEHAQGEKAPLPRLVLIIGEETFECKNGDILGREGTVARGFFSAIGTVSRQHVVLAERDGSWFVSVSPGVQNVTQLDGRELPRDAGVRLVGEHALKLSTQCEVRLKVVGAG